MSDLLPIVVITVLCGLGWLAYRSWAGRSAEVGDGQTAGKKQKLPGLFPMRVDEARTRDGEGETANSNVAGMTQAPRSLYQLRSVTGSGKTYRLVDGENEIGRKGNPRLTVALEDKSVSQHHATITIHADGSLSVTDKSRYGSMLNKQKLSAETATPLQIGDVLKVGETLLKVEMEEEYAPIAPRRYQLRVQSGPDKGKTLVLSGKRSWIVGRSVNDGCDWSLSDGQVSRQHAEVILEGASVRVVDKGSRHGMLINGHRQQDGALQIQDIWKIGNSEIILEELSS